MYVRSKADEVLSGEFASGCRTEVDSKNNGAGKGGEAG